MTLYIAGPMSGIDDFNRPAFNDAARRLRAYGYEVRCPAETDGGSVGKDWAWYMRHDLQMLLDCDGVVTLNGWQRSRGASLEVFIACQLGITVTPLAEILRYAEGVRAHDYQGFPS